MAGKSFAADLTPGTPGASVLPELGQVPSDIVLTRTHGVGPMTGTDLDSVLRNLNIKTIVGVGVSVNIAIPNFVMDAVNRSYQFVLPRDAVSGYPRDYAESVIDNTLALLATVTTTDAVVDAWRELSGALTRSGCCRALVITSFSHSVNGDIRCSEEESATCLPVHCRIRSSISTTTCMRQRRSDEVPSQAAQGKGRLRRGQRPAQARRQGSHQPHDPQPHVRACGQTGQRRGLLPREQPRRPQLPRVHRRSNGCHSGVPVAGTPPRADGRVGHRPGRDVSDARQPRRGTHHRRRHPYPRHHPCAQRVDARALDVRLPGPYFRDTRHLPATRRRGDQRAALVPRTGHEDVPDPSGTGAQPLRRIALDGTAGVRPLLGRGRQCRHSGHHARLG